MSEFSDQAILLRSMPYRETSCILHLLSAKHGRISLLARGVRKQKSPFRADLAPLYLLQLTWKQGKSDLGYLQSIQRLQALVAEAQYLEGLAFNSLVYQLFPAHQPIAMPQLLQTYALLDKRTSGLLHAAWSLLAQQGWVGELHHCWHCAENKQPLYWSQAHCCCQSCGQGMSLSKGLCLSIESSLQNANVRLSQRYQSDWFNMIQDVLQHHGLKRLNRIEVSSPLPNTCYNIPKQNA